MNIHLVSVATEQTQELERFINSAIYYGFNPVILGLGEQWNSGEATNGRLDYPGGGMKVRLLKEYLETTSLNEDDLLLFTDSYDVVINQPSQRLVELWAQYGADYVAFAAEKVCWPVEKLSKEYPEGLSEYRYLNSGSFIGYVKSIRKIVNKPIIDEDDDQLYYTYQFLSDDSNIVLDYTQVFFQCLSKSEDDVEVNSDGFLINKTHNNIPVVIHGNGGKDVRLVLNRLTNKLRPFGSYSLEYNHQPKVQLNVLIEEDTHIMTLLHTLNTLSYDRDKIRLRLYTNNEKVLWYFNYFTADTKYTDIKITMINKDGYEIRNDIFEEKVYSDIDIVMFMDGNVEIKNNNIIQLLSTKLYNGFVTPMMNQEKSLLSNFWSGVSYDGYYEEREEYFTYRNYEKTGTFYVPYVSHIMMYDDSMFEVLKNGFDRTEKDKEYYGDDYYVVFSRNMRDKNVLTYIDNERFYGRMLN